MTSEGLISGLRKATLSAAFALTGVGTALLGAALPATLHAWHLSDNRGGLLLLAAWGGSTSGALLIRGVSGNSAALGLIFAAVGMFALSLPHPPALLWLYLLYGIGLGMTMTAISMIRSREVSAAEADVALNRLNLIWAIGACIAPPIAFRSLQMLSVSALFRGMSFAFGLVGLVLFAANALVLGRRNPAAQVEVVQRSSLPWAPLRLLLFAAAAVGLESAVGSWLTTYTQRMTHGAGLATSANSAFWAGLLISRAMHSVHWAPWIHSRQSRVVHLALVGVSTIMFVGSPTGIMLPLAGLLSGLGLGPLYPHVLSVALPRYRSNAVFVLAGVGASVLPWLTGTVSAATNSLRMGLLVPCFGFLLLIGAALRMGAE